MKLIDADNLHNAKFQDPIGYGENVAYRIGWNDAIDAICENEPTIDAVEVVRCQDCKWNDGKGHCKLRYGSLGVFEDVSCDDYCSYGCKEGE